jgi:hypothetical protein
MPDVRRPRGIGALDQSRPVAEISTRARDGTRQSCPIATIREVVAAMLVGQNPDTTLWTGDATHAFEAPVREVHTRVIVLAPLRTNATKPWGPAARVVWYIACGPLRARVQLAPSVELQNARS